MEKLRKQKTFMEQSSVLSKDLYIPTLQKYTDLGNGAYKVVLATDTVPSQEKLQDFFNRAFDNKVSVVTASVEMHGQYSLSCIIQRNSEVKTFERKDTGMKLVTANVFKDERDNSIWVLKDVAGERSLVRQSDDDLGDLLQAKLVRKGLHTASIQVPMEQDVGYYDFVAAYSSKDQEIIMGWYAKRKGKDVVVSKEGVARQVAKASILARYKCSEKEEELAMTENDASTILNYYKKLYEGSDFYAKLVALVEGELRKTQEGEYYNSTN